MIKPQIVIIKDRKAPIQSHRKSGTSFWRDVFESMDVADWFVLDKSDMQRVKMSATKYMRGRYRCYINSETEGTYVFTKTK